MPAKYRFRLAPAPEDPSEAEVTVAGLDFWPTREAPGGKRPWDVEYTVGRICFLGPAAGYGALLYSILPFDGKPHLRAAAPFPTLEHARAWIEEQAKAEIARVRRRHPYYTPVGGG